jgi:hypothetical protein
MDAEVLIESYEARKPLYTEGDFVKRFAEIKSARTMSMPGGSTERPPDDRMIALLASGRVSDAEYFRLAGLLGFDPAGLIYSEPPTGRRFAGVLLAALRAILDAVGKLRRD